MWPPPANPSDDEPPKYEPSLMTAGPACGKEPTTRTVSKVSSDSQSKMASVQQQSVEQFVTSTKQREEISSSMSYSSAAMSSMTSTSKSESVIQSKQVMQESSSRTIQSFSEESSASQSSTVYQKQTNLPMQKQIDNPNSNVENIKTVQSVVETNEAQSKRVSELNKEEDRAQTIEQNKISISNQNSDIKENTNPNTAETQEVEKPKEAPIQSEPDKFTTTQQKESMPTQCKTEFVNKHIEESNMNIERSRQETIANVSTNPGTINRSPMVDALTTAPDRPYSPLPTTPQPISTIGQPTMEQAEKTNYNAEEIERCEQNATEIDNMQLPAQPSPMFLQEQKRGITPIPPIKTYNPPEKVAPPIPMPEETKPYIPPDFKINIEPKVPRDATASPLIEALTTTPNRPFTPTTMVQNQSMSRGSLRDALTIAPDRPYSPFRATSTTQSSQYMTSSVSHVTETNLSDIIKPIATQTSTQMTDKIHSEFSAMQNTCQLQSSSEMSAFRPVAKQVFPPPLPEEFCKLSNFPPISNDLKTSFTQATKTKQETSYSESLMMQHSSISTSMASQGFSSVKSAQNYFEQLDKKESLTSTASRSKSGLHKPDSIPPYQRNFEQLPSQRGITPELYNAPAVLQRPVTPTTDPPRQSKERSAEPRPTYVPPQVPTPKIPQIKTPVPQPQPAQFHKDTPITMTFQPVTDENYLRTSPSRSRPTTPSLINKPAPIIPHYQMNLVTVEHMAPESHLYEPSSREASRSPTPKPRSRSPAQGPPPNPLKAQAPRIKEWTPQGYSSDSSNIRKQHEMEQTGYHSAAQLYNTNDMKNWGQNQPTVVKDERHSNVAYKSEKYEKGDMRVNEDSLTQENYGQRQLQSQNVIEQGNTTVHTTRKTFEEFERTQSAKVIEIRKGGSSFSGAFEQDSNIRPSSINPKQVFPPPLMTIPPTQQSSSFNQTNQNVASASRAIENYEPSKPSISGANLGPVCDPTPSTGSSVGAAARGKTFGVSSAPKRGRGVLNKAALPGSRVPLCASCNGNIR